LLPDRHAMLDFVDDVAAGAEGLVAMRGRGAHPDGGVGQCQAAQPVHAQDALDAEALLRLLDDALALAHAERLEGLVFQPRDLLPLVVVAHPAFEGGESAAVRIDQLGAQRHRVDGLVREAERAHPPATGGMKTTVSLAASWRDQSENSAFTATFRCSGPSVKGWRTFSSSYSSRGVAARVRTVSSRRPACSRSRAKYCTLSSRSPVVAPLLPAPVTAASSAGVFTFS